MASNLKNIFFVSVIVLALLFSGLAQAQKVDIRTGRHDGYSRIVFDWTIETSYGVERTAKTDLKISFDRSAMFDLPSLQSNLPANILEIERVQQDKKTLSVKLEIPENSRVRDFAIGNRMIVDVYDPPGGPVKPAPKSDEQTAGNETETPAPSPSKPDPSPSNKQEITQNDDYKVEDGAKIKPEKVSADSLQDAPTDKIANLSEDFPEPTEGYSLTGRNTITLTSTRAIHASVFSRGNRLWIIHDQPDNNVPPKIEGPDKEIIPKFQPVEVGQDVKAFTLRLPDDGYVQTEGGGLLWRIILSPERLSEKKYVQPKIRFSGQNNKQASLFWKMPSAHFLKDVIDPVVGDKLHVVGVGKAKDLGGPVRSYVQLSTLPGYAGIVLDPKVDDLSVSIQDRGILVTKDNGLVLTKGRDIQNVFSDKNNEQTEKQEDSQEEGQESEQKGDEEETQKRVDKIYDFNRWVLGGPVVLGENETTLLGALKQSDKVGKTETLLALGKLFLANSRGPEALGYFNYAGDVTPDLKESPEYLALLGAAEALTGQYEAAFKDYAAADLDRYKEVDLWRSMVLAGLGDWGQAGEVLPEDTSIVNSYPSPLRQEVALTLAEVALRDGRQDQADELLAIPKALSEDLIKSQKAALDYLSGEAHRQRGENERAVALWEPLAKSLDDLHRVKAGLALSKLLYEMDKISADEGIDRLEQLRYGWRGDTLETRVYIALGEFYLKNGNYLKGLAVLRRATELSTTPTLLQEITSNMTRAFEKLFLTDEINKLSPLEAVGVYQEFQELTPSKEKGDRITRKLAERLVDVGLLGRASDLMDKLIETQLSGMNAAKTAVRLATIQLLDDKPDEALISLKKAQEFVAASKNPTTDLDRDIALLKARAYSDKGLARRALSTLSRVQDQDEDVLRLRADISWQNGEWNEAARALERLVTRERISIQQPLSERQANLILNWAVALNLAGDRRALGDLRNRFSSAMQETTRARLFEVVTRPRQNVRLSDRETIRAIVSEVDLFRDFLTSYEENTAGETN